MENKLFGYVYDSKNEYIFYSKYFHTHTLQFVALNYY